MFVCAFYSSLFLLYLILQRFRLSHKRLLREYHCPALLHAAVFHLDAEEAVTIESGDSHLFRVRFPALFSLRITFLIPSLSTCSSRKSPPDSSPNTPHCPRPVSCLCFTSPAMTANITSRSLWNGFCPKYCHSKPV